MNLLFKDIDKSLNLYNRLRCNGINKYLILNYIDNDIHDINDLEVYKNGKLNKFYTINDFLDTMSFDCSIFTDSFIKKMKHIYTYQKKLFLKYFQEYCKENFESIDDVYKDYEEYKNSGFINHREFLNADIYKF